MNFNSNLKSITFWDIEKINNDQRTSKPCGKYKELLQKTRAILFSKIYSYGGEKSCSGTFLQNTIFSRFGGKPAECGGKLNMMFSCIKKS